MRTEMTTSVNTRAAIVSNKKKIGANTKYKIASPVEPIMIALATFKNINTPSML